MLYSLHYIQFDQIDQQDGKLPQVSWDLVIPLQSLSLASIHESTYQGSVSEITLGSALPKLSILRHIQRQFQIALDLPTHLEDDDLHLEVQNTHALHVEELAM